MATANPLELTCSKFTLHGRDERHFHNSLQYQTGDPTAPVLFRKESARDDVVIDFKTSGITNETLRKLNDNELRVHAVCYQDEPDNTFHIPCHDNGYIDHLHIEDLHVNAVDNEMRGVIRITQVMKADKVNRMKDRTVLNNPLRLQLVWFTHSGSVVEFTNLSHAFIMKVDKKAADSGVRVGPVEMPPPAMTLKLAETCKQNLLERVTLPGAAPLERDAIDPVSNAPVIPALTRAERLAALLQEIEEEGDDGEKKSALVMLRDAAKSLEVQFAAKREAARAKKPRLSPAPAAPRVPDRSVHTPSEPTRRSGGKRARTAAPLSSFMDEEGDESTSVFTYSEMSRSLPASAPSAALMQESLPAPSALQQQYAASQDLLGAFAADDALQVPNREIPGLDDFVVGWTLDEMISAADLFAPPSTMPPLRSRFDSMSFGADDGMPSDLRDTRWLYEPSSPYEPTDC